MADPNYSVGGIKQCYTRLESKRRPFLDRARASAVLTIPSLMVPEGHNAHSVLPTPWQGLGARGTNNLTAKLLLALLPPNAPFMRFRVDTATLRQLEQGDIKTAVENALQEAEGVVMQEIEADAVRVPTYEVLRQLLVSGNVLLYFAPEGGLQVYRLDSFCVVRDNKGNVLEIVTKEQVSPLMLDEEVRELVGNSGMSGLPSENGNTEYPEWTVYTRVCRHVSRRGNVVWREEKEINGVAIPGSVATYPIDKSPWLALRFQRIDGESYGRGYVEEYIGDLRSLEGLTQAIVEGSAAAAKVLFLVNPTGVTKQKDVANSPNGAVREGRADDVTVLQMQKFNDFRVAQQTMQSIADQLMASFLMNSSVQRDAERVTAEEVRLMAGELQDALGGVYSILSIEFQLPLVRIYMDRLRKQGRFPKFPKVNGKEVVNPIITTGLEALGRGHDLGKLRGLIEDVAVVAKAQQMWPRLKGDTLVQRLATARGIDVSDLFLSEDAYQATLRQQQMAKLAEKAAAPVAGAVAKGMVPDQPNEGN